MTVLGGGASGSGCYGSGDGWNAVVIGADPQLALGVMLGEELCVLGTFTPCPPSGFAEIPISIRFGTGDERPQGRPIGSGFDGGGGAASGKGPGC